MAEKKNALSELANNIDIVKQGLSELNENNDLVLSDKGFVILDKVQRIIAELASYYEPCFPAKSGDDVIDECRAIAEEGGVR